MLGHYLLTLSEEQENRVLTRMMHPGDTHMGGYKMAPCVVIVAGDNGGVRHGLHGWVGGDRHGQKLYFAQGQWWKGGEPALGVGYSYDCLCERFGASRVNAAIRSRIWSNRARRILQNAPVSRDTEVDAQSVGECRFGRGE